MAAHEFGEHEGLEESSLREHEEFTKVKNLNDIELGMYRMVSPLAVKWIEWAYSRSS